jgi:Uma2 family endonuclease
MESLPIVEHQPWVFHFPQSVKMTPEQFWEASQINRDVRIELTAEGELIIMPPTGARTGARNIRLSRQVSEWADRDGSGVAFDSSTGFVLPNGAIRSPDVAWVRRTRLAVLPPEQLERFLPLCPDFVIELKSPSDLRATVHDKLREYIANGAQLGWLIDPVQRQVDVYQANGNVGSLAHPESIAGDPILPGFVLDLALIWEPGV